MRTVSLIVIAILLSGLVSAQSPRIVWQKNFGGQGYDRGLKMIPTDEGCFILAGFTASADGIGKGTLGVPKNNLCIMKVASNGHIIWVRSLGGSAQDDLNGIAVTRDKGVIAIGTTESFDGAVEGKHPKQDIWVVKLDRLGTVQWKRCFGGMGNDKGMAVIQTSDGGYLIGGESGSKDGDMTISNGGLDAWVAKLDKKGNIQRSQSFGGIANETVTQLIEMEKNQYMIVATSTSSNGHVKGAKGEKDAWVFVLSKNFDFVWQKNYGGSDFDDAHVLIRNKEGNYILAGTSFSADGDLEGQMNSGMGDLWVFSIDPEGNMLWGGLYGGSRSDGANGISQTPDGGYMVVGSSSSKDKMMPRMQGYYDAFLLRIDPKGKVIWSSSLGGEEFDHLYDVMALKNGNYLALGSTESTKGDVLSLDKGPGDDFWWLQFTDPEAKPVELDFKPYMAGYTMDATTKQSVLTEVILFDNGAMKEIGRIKSDTADGMYFWMLDPVALKNGTGKYSVNFVAPGYMLCGRDISLDSMMINPEVRIDALLKPIRMDESVALRNIYFDTGKWDLRPESRPEMERLTKFLKTNPSIKIEIGGHTDNTGDASSKKELSFRRAVAMRDWLLKAGVAGTRLTTQGYGMYYPICTEDTEECRALNRRVEVKIIGM